MEVYDTPGSSKKGWNPLSPDRVKESHARASSGSDGGIASPIRVGRDVTIGAQCGAPSQKDRLRAASRKSDAPERERLHLKEIG